MRDTDDMINITQREFEQLIRHDTCGIAEAKERMISEDSPQTHRARVQNALVAQVAE